MRRERSMAWGKIRWNERGRCCKSGGAGCAVRCPLRDDLISKSGTLSSKVTPLTQECREVKKTLEIERRSQSPLEATAWADVDEQFQCLRDAVSRNAQVLPTYRQVNEGTRKEQVPARIMLVEAHSPLGALIRAFLRPRRSNNIAGRTAVTAFPRTYQSLCPSFGVQVGIRHLDIIAYMWNVGIGLQTVKRQI